MFPLASVATSPGRLSSPLPVPPGTPHVNSNVPQLHSPQLPPQPSSPHALPVQFGVQHIPNFTAAAFAHTRLQQLWLVRQVRPSGLQPPRARRGVRPASVRRRRGGTLVRHASSRTSRRASKPVSASSRTPQSRGRRPASSSPLDAIPLRRASAVQWPPPRSSLPPPRLPVVRRVRFRALQKTDVLCREGTPDPPRSVPSMAEC